MIVVMSNDVYMNNGITHVAYRILYHVENTQAVYIFRV